MDTILAHTLCLYNRESILKSKNCGCFHCLQVFPADMIIDWCDVDEADIGRTAICPLCAVDAIIADSDMLLDEQFLKSMHECWF